MSTQLDRPISEAVALAWAERTEGWVTALQLAVLSLRQRGPASELTLDIPRNVVYLEEYILSEVLTHLSRGQLEWLRAAAVLDRFCASLLDAVCHVDSGDGDDPQTGAECLTWLQRNSLFLIPLDNEQRWFRFHHLFQQLLLDQLGAGVEPTEAPAIHLRASRWFAHHGLLDEAIRHAIAGEDYAAAIAVIAQNRFELMNALQWQRLDGWLQLLPAAVVAQDPYLMSIRVYLALHLHSPEYSAADTAVRQALETHATQDAAGAPLRVIQAEVAINDAALRLVMGDSDAAMAAVRESLPVLPDRAQYVRVLAHAVIAVSRQMQGNYAQGVAHVEALLAGTDLPPMLRGILVYYLCLNHYLEGNLPDVILAAHECLRIAVATNHPGLLSMARSKLGTAHYLRNELETAEEHLHALLEQHVTAQSTNLAVGTIAAALVSVARGHWNEADEVIDLAYRHFGATNNQYAIAITQAFRVELALRKGDLAEAQRRSHGVNFAPSPPGWYFYVPQITRLKLLWFEGTPESLQEASAELAALEIHLASIHRHAIRIDVRCLQALVSDARGERPAAVASIMEALALATPGQFVRNFVDFGSPMARLLEQFSVLDPKLPLTTQAHLDRILAAFSPDCVVKHRALTSASNPEPAAPDTALAQPLTRRERQVLSRLGTEQSPAEIGEDLVISTSTVRSHIKSIYQKLDVHSRFEAIDRAKRLDLL